eukprot:812646-Rhodomonas_salina.1
MRSAEAGVGAGRLVRNVRPVRGAEARGKGGEDVGEEGVLRGGVAGAVRAERAARRHRRGPPPPLHGLGHGLLQRLCRPG